MPISQIETSAQVETCEMSRSMRQIATRAGRQPWPHPTIEVPTAAGCVISSQGCQNVRANLVEAVVP